MSKVSILFTAVSVFFLFTFNGCTKNPENEGKINFFKDLQKDFTKKQD